MAITFRSASTLVSGTRTNSTINAPSGAVNGSDAIVVGIGCGNPASTTISTPAGWTLLGTVAYTAPDPYAVNLYLFVRIHDGSASYTFTHASATTDAIALAYSGVDTATPSDTTAATQFQNFTASPATVATLAAITIATSGAMRIGFRGAWDGNAITPPASWTERGDQPVNWIGEILASGTGSTGTTSVDHGNSTNNAPWGTIHAALRPGTAVASSPPPPLAFPPWGPPWIAPRTRPPQLLGDASGGQVLNLDETATGADSLAVAATIPISGDTAAGSDDVTVAAAFSLTETPNTADDLVIIRPDDPNQNFPHESWFLLQPGIGPHAPVLQLLGDAAGNQVVNLDDTATADDTAVVAPAIPLTETASGTDSLTVAAAAPLADTAAGTDLATVTAAVPLAETGTAADSLAAQSASDPDPFQVPRWLPGMFLSPRLNTPQGLGDSTSVVIITDTAAGDDSLTVAVAIPATDTASGADALTVAAAVTLQETGAAADALAANAAAPLDDTAGALDLLSVVIQGEPDGNQFLVPSKWGITRPGVAMDPPALQLLGDASGSNQVSLTESATADDSLTVAVSITMSDTAVGADALAVAVAVPLSELVAASDAIALAVVLALTETGTGLDELSVNTGGGVRGDTYPRGDGLIGGNVYPRSTRSIIGTAG